MSAFNLNTSLRSSTPTSSCDARSVSSFPILRPSLDNTPDELLDYDFRSEESRWNALCASMGINPPEVPLNASARRLASKLRRKQSTPSKQVSESLSYLLNLAIQDDLALASKSLPFLHTDALPKSLLDEQQQSQYFDVRPTMAFGHGWRLFPDATRMAMTGIISNGDRGLFNLEKMAESCPGLYWSFFCVNMSGKSLQKARRASTVSAAIFSNALNMYITAVKSAYGLDVDPAYLEYLEHAVKSFSLSVHGKLGSLDMHGLDENGEPTSTIIAVYQLDDEIELETLIARIQTIFAWANSFRLPLILDLIDLLSQQRQIEANVKQLARRSHCAAMKPIPQQEIQQLQEVSTPTPVSRRKVIKSVLRESMPLWSRAKA